MGTFPTQDQAALGNEIARGKLTKEKGPNRIAEEIEQNVQLAKEAASKAPLLHRGVSYIRTSRQR